MAMTVTIEDIRPLMEDVFQLQDLSVAPETNARDIKAWDSLNNVRLMLRVESEFGVDLPVDKVEGLKNVGQLLALINSLRA